MLVNVNVECIDFSPEKKELNNILEFGVTRGTL